MGGHVIKHLTGCDGVRGIIAYDLREEQLRTVRNRYQVQATSRLSDILTDPEVRLVFVTASNDAHKALTVQSLEAGKAVLCEKPMATSLSDAAEMVEVAERRRVFLQIGFELRYSKLYVKVKEWIDAGLLGRVTNTDCCYVASEFWGRASWRCKKASGGMFGEKLSHYVDLPRWWIGSEVTDVFSVCSPNIVPYFEVRDNYHATYRFRNGAVSHLGFLMGPAATCAEDPLMKDPNKWDFGKLKNDGHELRYRIVGTKGAAETDAFNQTIKRWEFGANEHGFTSTLVETLTWSAHEQYAYTHNTLDQAMDIVSRVARGAPPMTAARDSYETMKLCFAAEESADRGELVSLQSLENCAETKQTPFPADDRARTKETLSAQSFRST